MKLSVIIPAHNEESCLESTVKNLHAALSRESIEHEILVINDNSTDGTEKALKSIQGPLPALRYLNNLPPGGFGRAVELGFKNFTGEAAAVYMADASDSPADLVRFFRTMEQEKVDCVFGTRFGPESAVHDYPMFKLTLNRIANTFIRLLFGIKYNDVTNAFKLYHRRVIEGVAPIFSRQFNLTVELPLKAIVRGYTYKVIPNSWTNRKAGESKLKIKEMGSRYVFIILYCLLEKWLSRGDYLKHDT